MKLDSLKTLGLAPGEIKTYEAILISGIATINIIHEKTGIERRGIYDTINKLIKKGLIAYIVEDGKRTYHIAPPSKLQEEANKIKEDLTKFESLMPDIQKIYEAEKPEIGLEAFRGIEGIKSIWEDMLNYKEIRWIGSGNYMPSQHPIFFKHWNTKRKEKKIKSLHLFRKEIRSKVIKDAGDAKFLPEEFSGNPTVTCIYGNKVVNFLFSGDFFAFVIESKELADNYRRYHKYLWDKVGKK
jgi:sugar-specific transcriptional regulator TrmB